jgi:4'-phosphopantetheinyl transferase
METHPVDLWTLTLTSPCPAHLSADELARANRFRFEGDRVRWSRARSWLRMLLSTYTGCEPGDLGFSYGNYGKPALQPFTGIHFNLSHSGDWAMLAVTRSVPVGADIERMRTNVDMASLLTRLHETDLPNTQPELYQAWTRREAKSKAAGGALMDQPADDICAIDVIAPDGYAASVALVGFKPAVTYRDTYCGNR